jgi:hypothetical protein
MIDLPIPPGSPTPTGSRYQLGSTPAPPPQPSSSTAGRVRVGGAALPGATPGASPGDGSLLLAPDADAGSTPAWPVPVRTRSRAPRSTRQKAILGIASAVSVVIIAGVLVGVIQHLGGSGTVAATGARVTASPRVAGCGTAVHIAGVVFTNGAAGTIDYVWIRNGQRVGGVQHAAAARDQTSLSLPDFTYGLSGSGTVRVQVALQVVGPTRLAPVPDEFTYSCAA